MPNIKKKIILNNKLESLHLILLKGDILTWLNYYFLPFPSLKQYYLFRQKFLLFELW